MVGDNSSMLFFTNQQQNIKVYDVAIVMTFW